MTQPRPGRWVGLALLVAYTAFLVGVNISARRSSLTPIVLYAPDVMVAEDAPVTVRVVALDAAKGEPIQGVPLRFVRELGPRDGSGELSATTGLDGTASITFQESSPPPGDTGSIGVMGSRVVILLLQPSAYILAGPWPARAGEQKRAWAEVVELRPKTKMLLVDLDGALEQGTVGGPAPTWPSSPPHSLSDRVLEESRLRTRTLYVATVTPALEQRCKAWISFSGLPDGAFEALGSGQKKEVELAALAARLRELQVETSLIVAGPGVEALYSRCFPGSALTEYER